MQNGKITIYDIAAEAGVSTSTVSRVLSGHPNVSPKTAQKVRRVVEKYRFTPSSVARGLYHRTSHLIGILMPGIENPYYAGLFSAAYQEAHQNGYAVLMYRTSPTEQLDASFADQMIERRLDGVLMLGGAVESDQASRQLVPALKALQQHMPLVTICPPIEGVDCINFYSDLTASVRQSVHHLHGLGHKRMAFLGGSYESRSASEREKGFFGVTAALGLSQVYSQESGHTPEAGELGVAQLLCKIDRPAWPTALICINDLVALGAMRQLKRLHLRVPEDMAVIGCDNQFFTPYTDPPMTTVDNHAQELGRVALAQLLSAIAGGGQSPVFTQVRESSLVVRESCGVLLGRRKLA